MSVLGVDDTGIVVSRPPEMAWKETEHEHPPVSTGSMEITHTTKQLDSFYFKIVQNGHKWL